MSIGTSAEYINDAIGGAVSNNVIHRPIVSIQVLSCFFVLNIGGHFLFPPGIMIDAEQGTKMNDYKPIKGTREKEIHMPVYNLTGRKFPEKYYNSYPTIQALAGISNAEVDVKGDVVEYAK